ncbi:MAG: SusD/RagB family nutrient-binding outer membrane lipoprotein [Tannerellaceae bacterium]|nr:SusD/RagB family nutrient-binding outer membrane lipoprotein [Tannerellaceae bacterium]
MILNKSIPKTFLGALGVYLMCACTGNFDDINRDPYGVDDEELGREGYNVGASLTGLQSFVIPTQEHLHQFHEVLAGCAFGGYLASTPEWTARFATYNPPQDWIKAPFNDVISGIYPYYEQMHAVTEDPIPLSLAKLLRVASMHRVTDTFGPIPYSQMSAAGGNSDGGNSLTAAYDSQEEVYKHMFEDLDEVIELLTENQQANTNIYRNFDNVYGGNIVQWIRFANSLKLRMAMRMSYVDETSARKYAEEAVSHSIGVITSNADNAYLKVNTNPLEMQAIQWGDERAGADLVSYMNGYNDPRRDKYFEESTFEAAGITNGFHGFRSGIDVSSKTAAMQYSTPIVDVSDPIMWMNAAEVAFLKAEGALRGWNMGGTANDLYNEGIILSFSQHGASGVENYIEDNTSLPAGYTDPLGTYTYSGTTSTITIKWDPSAGFETNLERIITQKWIANYPLGNEAWAEYRRTGYPKLMPVILNKSGGTVDTQKMIRRLPYPDTEYTENAENIAEAIRLLGGPDTGGTNLWWDTKK